MKHIYLIVIIYFLAISCKKPNVIEVKPYDKEHADSTQVLLVKDKYPCMKLATNNAISLPVSETESDLEECDIRIKRHYIALETTEECLIGTISKILSEDSCVFIFDRANNSVLRFSQKDGSFLNKFGNQGRGPGEYTELVDISLNKKNKELCLYDQFGYKNMYFSYDGTLLREEPLYYFYNRIEFLGDYRILHTDLNQNTQIPSICNNRLVLAEPDQTPLYVGFAFPEKLSINFHQGSKHPLITCNGDIYYTHVLSDTIWQIKKDGICEAKYIFKFPNRGNLFDERDFSEITDDEYKDKTNSVPYYRDECIITKNFLIAKFNKAADLLYCISTGHYLHGKIPRMSFGIGSTLFAQFTINDSSFVEVLQPFEIIKKHQQIKNEYSDFQYDLYWNKQLTEEERQLLGNMTEEDNPILMIMDIEPF
jgi:hypothetical protein bfra3_20315